MVLVVFLYMLGGAKQLHACGSGSFQWGAYCDENCNLADISTSTYSCYSDGNQCVMRVVWTGCYEETDKDGNKYCKYHRTFPVMPCDNYVNPPSVGGGGGCAPPPGPRDLAVEWPYREKVKATMTNYPPYPLIHLLTASRGGW